MPLLESLHLTQPAMLELRNFGDRLELLGDVGLVRKSSKGIRSELGDGTRKRRGAAADGAAGML